MADFDIRSFMNHIRATKPPYECPKCQKVYKTFNGIQAHIQACAGGSDETEEGSAQSGSSAYCGNTRENLTYAQAQKFVEVEIDGKLQRINIFEPLEVMVVDDPNAPPPKRSPTVAVKPPGSPKGKSPEAMFRIIDDYIAPEVPFRLPTNYLRYVEKTAEDLEAEVEYDIDEEDSAWLEMLNAERTSQGLPRVSDDVFEMLMDRLEKESYFQNQCKPLSLDTATTSANAAPALSPGAMDENAVCCVCNDGECENSNAILFCDMCNLAVHQECYGVPYIPEGQWHCRRCHLSPSCAVDCALCPNNGGALKPTADGRWAHVICAIWVPEVQFSNVVFLEPIEGMERIPAARWKLSCYICKQRGIGACIQCHKPNCYTAFHVTCAQSAGLYMRIVPIHGGGSGSQSIRKTAYCDVHAPMHDPNDTESLNMSASVANRNALLTRKSKTFLKGQKHKDRKIASGENGDYYGADDLDAELAGGDSESSRKRIRKARKLLQERRKSVPTVSVPVIPKSRVDLIFRKVRVAGKNQLQQRLLAYWILKRKSRSGVPLLRRLAASYFTKKLEQREIAQRGSSPARRYTRKIRQDLERVRLLCELVHKREKQKCAFVLNAHRLIDLLLRPDEIFYVQIIKQLLDRDRYKIFSAPVSEQQVPGYRSVIKRPMDLWTMRNKALSFRYKNLDEVHDDLKLMIENCIRFNPKDSIFTKQALRFRKLGKMRFDEAKRLMAERARLEIEEPTFPLVSSVVTAEGGKKSKKGVKKTPKRVSNDGASSASEELGFNSMSPPRKKDDESGSTVKVNSVSTDRGDSTASPIRAKPRRVSGKVPPIGKKRLRPELLSAEVAHSPERRRSRSKTAGGGEPSGKRDDGEDEIDDAPLASILTPKPETPTNLKKRRATGRKSGGTRGGVVARGVMKKAEGEKQQSPIAALQKDSFRVFRSKDPTSPAVDELISDDDDQEEEDEESDDGFETQRNSRRTRSASKSAE